MVKYYTTSRPSFQQNEALSLPRSTTQEVFSQHILNYTPYVQLTYNANPQQKTIPENTPYVTDQPFSSKILIMNYTVDGSIAGIVNQNGTRALVKIQMMEFAKILKNCQFINNETQSEIPMRLTKRGDSVFVNIDEDTSTTNTPLEVTSNTSLW